MAVSDYSTTPGNNTSIGGVNIAENCAPDGINNAIRQLMADLKTLLGDVSPTEVAILDGATLTTTELNCVDGVTSAIQTQLDAKRALLSSAYNAQASQAASGLTAVQFTSIPSWVNFVVVPLNGLSMSGTESIFFQAGDSGGFLTSGYTAVRSVTVNAANPAVVADSSAAAFEFPMGNASNVLVGNVYLSRITTSGVSWTATWNLARFSGGSGVPDATIAGAGLFTLTGALDRVRVLRGTTNTFDAGSVGLGYV
ncbi:MAG: hypothetical protein ACRCSU_07870 [Paracoccaceae bacterium]